MIRSAQLLLFVAVAISACSSQSPLPPGAYLANSPITGPHAPASQASSSFDSPPRFLSGNAPVYPISRLLNGESGYATVEFTVEVDGTVSDVKVVQADYEYFGIHAAIAVKAWRFQAAVKDGHPVAVRARQSFHYTPGG